MALAAGVQLIRDGGSKKFNGSTSELWTPELTERLLKLWNEGVTVLAIAGELGASRNAVMGKIMRMKLPRRREPTNTYGKLKRAAEAGHHSAVIRNIRKGLPPPEFASGTFSNPKAWDALPGSRPVPLVDLEPHMCKWPIGDKPTLFCAEPATEGVYCASHHAMSWRAVPR